ncbi:hypothetical protein JOE37_000760 [Clavibacter michiganensis]|nr:hypothetical protein [Clavibacter michiganensis]
MQNDVLKLINTPAQTAFKKSAGQNNHFLITILVGLDAVKVGSATLNEEFSTVWNPRNHARSAARSREYALVTSLAWIVDLVDAYRKRTLQVDALFTALEVAVINNLDGGREKLTAVTDRLRLDKDDPELNLVLFGLNWRNATVHSGGPLRIRSQTRTNLEKHANDIASLHSGLDIVRAINSFEAGLSPSFKEVASIIAAAHRLIDIIDNAIVTMVNTEEYTEKLLGSYFKSRFSLNNQVYNQFWPGSVHKSRSRLETFLLQSGFGRAPDGQALSRTYLEELCALSARDAHYRFSPP